MVLEWLFWKSHDPLVWRCHEFVYSNIFGLYNFIRQDLFSFLCVGSFFDIKAIFFDENALSQNIVNPIVQMGKTRKRKLLQLDLMKSGAPLGSWSVACTRTGPAIIQALFRGLRCTFVPERSLPNPPKRIAANGKIGRKCETRSQMVLILPRSIFYPRTRAPPQPRCSWEPTKLFQRLASRQRREYSLDAEDEQR